MAASATERVSGPTESHSLLNGITPWQLTSPNVGRRPTNALIEAGARTLQFVSVPIPAVAKLAETATAVPPLDPPQA